MSSKECATIRCIPMKMADNHINCFNLERTKKCLEDSIIQETDISLSHFITAYHELCRFFDNFGAVFGFIVKDVNDKLKILKGLVESPDSHNYAMVLKMLKYETGHSNWGKKSSPQGSRTLVKLNRALSFISQFMRNVSNAPKDVSMADVAHGAYTETLYKYHKWYVRKAVALAVYTLPSRDQFVQHMNIGDVEEDELRRLTQQLVNVVDNVYSIIHRHYENFDLVELQ